MCLCELNFRKNKMTYAVTAALILMLQSSAMAAQATDSLVGQETVALNPQYSDNELVWLLSGSNLTAQDNTLTHQNGTLAATDQQIALYHIGLESASEIQVINNSMTLSDTTFNFDSTATDPGFAVINIASYDTKNVALYNNTLAINKLQTNGSIFVYGAVTAEADIIDAKGNSVEVKGLTMTSENSAAEQIIFDVTGVEVSKNTDSAQKTTYTVDDTKLTLENLTITGSSGQDSDGEDFLAVAVRVYDADEAYAKGNTVSANNLQSRYSMFAAVRVQGDATEKAVLSENRIYLSQASFGERLTAYGARAAISGSVEISDNIVQVSDVDAGSLRLYAGRYYQTEIPTIDAALALNDNQLLISDTEVSGEVDLYGARASAASSIAPVKADSIQINNNRLTLKDSQLGGNSDIFAAYSSSEAVVEMNSNVLTVSNVQFDGDATHRAGYGLGKNVSLNGNRLIVNEGAIFNQGAELVVSEAMGVKSSFVSDNLLEVEDATFKGNASDPVTLLAGAHIYGEDVQVNNSKVNVSNTEFQTDSFIQGAWMVGETLNAQNVAISVSNVNISDDALGMGVYGTDVGLIQGGALTSVNSSIAIEGSTLTNGFVLGAYVQGEGDNTIHFNQQTIQVSDSTVGVVSGLYLNLESAQGNVSAEMNDLTVSLTDATVLNGVYTGYTSEETSTQGVTPDTSNAIEVNNSRLELSGVNRVGGVLGFETFGMNVQEVNKDKALLTITGAAQGTQRHFDHLTIEIASDDFLREPDAYRLIQVEGNDQYVFSNLKVEADQTFVHTTYTATDDIVLSSEMNTLTSENELFKNKTVSATANSKTLSGTLLGSIAFVNQVAEFIADEGLESMTHAATDGTIAAFGAIHGGSSNYKADPRVDLDGYSLAAGVATNVTPDWVLGGFIEAGWADSSNHVQASKANGDHDYYGVGIATRYRLSESWYVDGSLRLGQSSTEFTGSYAKDSAQYDSNAYYVSAHAATGYVFNLTESTKLDLYGRYVVTYLDGDEVSLHNRHDQTLDMDSTVTHAVRLGTRMTGSFCPYADWKVGVAYEHVFDGDAESAINSLNLEVPSLEGDTGIMEVGVSMKPNLNSRWSLNLGARGYVGDREGLAGNAVIRYAF